MRSTSEGQGWLVGVGIAAAGGVLVGWFGGWIPDGVVGWPLFVGLLGLTALTGVAYAVESTTTVQRVIGTMCVLVAVGLAAWLPLRDLTGANILSAAALSRPGDVAQLPPVTEEHRTLELLAHADVRANAGDVPYHLNLATAVGDHRRHEDHFVDTMHHGRRRASREMRHDTLWALDADLSQGGTVSLDVARGTALQWPVELELRDPGPDATYWLLLMAPLFAIAVLLDARDRRTPSVALAGLVAGAVTFAVAFERAWAPGHLTKAVLAAALLGLAAALPAFAIVQIARKLGLRDRTRERPA